MPPRPLLIAAFLPPLAMGPATRASKRRRVAAAPAKALPSQRAHAPAAAAASAPAPRAPPAAPAPLVVLAHGAGAGSGHAWMQAWRARLAARLGAPVVCFDFPYMAAAGRRPPDRMPVLVSAFRDAVVAAVAAHPAAAAGGVVLAGKSMGGRVALYLAEQHGEELGVVGCVAFGYPASGKDEDRRRLPGRTSRPLMLVQGDRDVVARIGDVRGIVSAFDGEAGLLEVLEVEAGNHSLEVTKTWLKKNEQTQDDVDAGIAAAVAAWLDNKVRKTARTPRIGVEEGS